MSRYLKYSEDDFIMDPYFRNWVKNPSPASEIFWNKFLIEHPHKKDQIKRARALLESIVFKTILPASEKDRLWHAIVRRTITRGTRKIDIYEDEQKNVLKRNRKD